MRPGARIPALRLPSTHGPVDLAELARERLVLFVYPATGRPGGPPPAPGWEAIPGAAGCTAQACAFRDRRADVAAEVAGLSSQPLAEQEEFSARCRIPYRLISDPELRLAAALGLPTFEAAGRTFYRRLTLAAEGGVVSWVFYPVEHPERNPDDVIAWLALRFDGLVVDLDGVVWLGGEPVPGSVDALAELRARRIPLVFVTNDPTASRAEYAARLDGIGIPAAEEEIVTAASALGALIRRREGDAKPVYVVGSPSLKAELRATGLELDEHGHAAQVVAVGGHAGFHYGELKAAAQAVARGASLFAAGRDATFPMPDGAWPATGSILAAVETAAGVRATVAGKPERHIFELARERLAGCRHVAIVGDHLEADVAGGKRAGLATVLVLSGTTSQEQLDGAGIRPDLVVRDLAHLVDLHG